MFPVTFSYDSDEVNPVGESFVPLESFHFVLPGVPFALNDIFQGGQAIFEDSVIENVTASFQVILPPNSPVNNITFGFGGPGVIGYIDSNNQPGSGTFTFASAVPEPGLLPLLATMAGLLFAALRFRKSATLEGRRNKPLGGQRVWISSIVATEMRSPSTVNNQTPTQPSPGAERDCFQSRRLHEMWKPFKAPLSDGVSSKIPTLSE